MPVTVGGCVCDTAGSLEEVTCGAAFEVAFEVAFEIDFEVAFEVICVGSESLS